MVTCVHIDWDLPGLMGSSGPSVSVTRISGETVVSSSCVVGTVGEGGGCVVERGGLRLSVELPEPGEVMAGEEHPLPCKLLLA